MLSMLSLKAKYITDEQGKKVSVILPMNVFNAIMEELEQLEDIRLFDEAKKLDEPSFTAEGNEQTKSA